jgi:hypothetical protein
VDERRDPEKSTRAASEFLKRAYKKYGSWTLAAAAFNRGSKGIENALNGQHTSSYYQLYLNEETARYVFRILALKLIIEAPEIYGYSLSPSDYYQPVEYKTIFISESIQDLPQFAKSLGVSYQTLKEHNPWIQNTDYKLVLKEGKKIIYTYDFGDCWEHLIIVESRQSPDSEKKYPCCQIQVC